MENLILIGGIPGTGKTTLAYELAIKNKIDKVISIDTIKAAVQCFIPKEEDPYLYTTTHEAYQIEKMSVIDGYKRHCLSIWKYLIPVIGRMQDEKTIIIEGAQINMGMLILLHNIGITDVVYVNLYIDDEQKLVERYHMKEKIRSYNWIDNLSNIMEIQRTLLKECDQYNINTASLDSKTLADQISKLI